MGNIRQCNNFNGGLRCCYHANHTGDCYYSTHDESDRIRWKLAAEDRDELRSRIFHLETERDEARAAEAQMKLEVLEGLQLAHEIRQAAEGERDKANEALQSCRAALDDALAKIDQLTNTTSRKTTGD